MKCPSYAASLSRLLPTLLALSAFATIAGGCGANKPAWMSLDPDDWSNRRIADEPLVLELEGPISLDVASFAGDVIIEADPERTQGEVTIVREGRHGFGRSKDARASLADITASVEIVAADTSRGELGQTLRIRTETANAEPHLQRAHVYVKAPAIDGVFVQTHDGEVTATHVEGTVDIETSNGLASVRTNLAMTDPVTIINRNGDIIFRSSPGSRGAFDAQTINGRIDADLRFGSVRVTNVTRDDVYQATLNDGTNRMVFRTTNGDIKIAVMAENERTIILPSGRKPPREEPDDFPEPDAAEPASDAAATQPG